MIALALKDLKKKIEISYIIVIFQYDTSNLLIDY